METRKFISWRRVSTKKQGATGLGLLAQKQIIDYFIGVEKGELVADYEEVYTGTHLDGCTELWKAIEHCKREGATLIIAKSDRFRNTAEALKIYEEMKGNIYFCDLPTSDKFSITLFFALAEREALMIRIRTKAALDAKRARGEAMGGTHELWGKKTHRDRDEVLMKAHEASARVRRERMMSEPSNRFFISYVNAQRKKGRKFVEKEEFVELAEELNMMERTTPTGMAYDKKRAQSQYIKLANAGLFN